MDRRERSRRQKLAGVLDRLGVAEARALGELQAAGFRFQSIDAVKRYSEKLRAIEQFERDGDEAALDAALRAPRKARSTV